MDCCVASLLAMTAYGLPPRKYRLLQFRDAGVSSRQHFGELIDQRCGRRVDMLAGMAEADHAPRAFGNRSEAERVVSLDIVECDAMDGGDLRGVGDDVGAGADPDYHGRDQIARSRRIIV